VPADHGAPGLGAVRGIRPDRVELDMAGAVERQVARCQVSLPRRRQLQATAGSSSQHYTRRCSAQVRQQMAVRPHCGSALCVRPSRLPMGTAGSMSVAAVLTGKRTYGIAASAAFTGFEHAAWHAAESGSRSSPLDMSGPWPFDCAPTGLARRG
jgi:hypothetical protein